MQSAGYNSSFYPNPAVFSRLVQALAEDGDATVRDAAYGALLRLAAVSSPAR